MIFSYEELLKIKYFLLFYQSVWLYQLDDDNCEFAEDVFIEVTENLKYIDSLITKIEDNLKEGS